MNTQRKANPFFTRKPIVAASMKRRSMSLKNQVGLHPFKALEKFSVPRAPSAPAYPRLPSSPILVWISRKVQLPRRVIVMLLGSTLVFGGWRSLERVHPWIIPVLSTPHIPKLPPTMPALRILSYLSLLSTIIASDWSCSGYYIELEMHAG